MKLDKKLFKSIVKECLVEILTEGLYPNDARLEENKDSLKESMQYRQHMGLGKMNGEQRKNVQKKAGHSHSYLDKMTFKDSQEKISNPNFKKNARNIISKVTKDPIMSEIFADTISTTLQEQIESKGSGHRMTNSTPSDAAARIVASSDPADIFGEKPASRWASLAFSQKK